MAVKGARKGVHRRPLTVFAPRAQSKRERSEKAVQLSFVPWQDSFAASDQDSSPGILDGTAYSTSHLFDRQTKTMIQVSNSPILFRSKGRQGAQSISR